MGTAKLLAAILALALVPAAAGADEDAATEDGKREEEAKKVDGPANLDLDERIKPVTGFLFLKDGRHEVSPTMQLSLNDAFFTKYVFGLRYAYHITEKWSAGFNAGYALSTSSGAVSRCDARGENCEVPKKEDLLHTPGDIGLLAGVDVSWAPLYGKISVLAEKVLHFDTYVVAGGGVLQAKLAPADSTEVAAILTPEVHLGVGQRYFLGRSVTLRFEVRDLVYQLDISDRSDLQNQLLFSIGLSFFLGDMPQS